MSKCKTCKFKRHYRTGSDEYPPQTSIEYCGKGYWEDNSTPTKEEIKSFENCIDYKNHDNTN